MLSCCVVLTRGLGFFYVSVDFLGDVLLCSDVLIASTELICSNKYINCYYCIYFIVILSRSRFVFDDFFFVSVYFIVIKTFLIGASYLI